MSAGQSMRSPLGRVRHHGAAGEGAGHFIAMRVTSIALAVLAPWFAVSAAMAMRVEGYAAVIDFLTQPANAIGTGLLLVVGLHHMALGMQEVILDYIRSPGTKILLLLLNTLAPIALGACALFALLAVNFGI